MACAFCTSATFATNTFSITTAVITKDNTFIRHISTRSASQRVKPLLPKRQRTKVGPTCQFNNNRNNNQPFNQIADLLIGTGQFFRSTSGQVILWAVLVWLVLTGKIGVLFDSFLILFAVVSIVPVIALLIFRWTINRQIVRGTCPSCGAPVTSLRGQPIQCTNCGNTMQTEDRGNFSVKDPSSATIDIDAKEISDM